MIQILTVTTQQEEGGALFLKIILFIYFIPSMIALLRLPVLKFKFLIVLLVNVFFGWTVYGWWLSFIKAVSSSKG
ncbi:superinfection immunity protein [Chryseobacterium limigenitum]|uniref:T4 immunity holin family protein n=1 Tax=Chryseobacterium limigenitum TaxID=1612149 RepID=A0A1K2IFH5_9FLAO|nr:T4 immunity holin family protein [Chryseobacterium limigenitum]